MNEHRSKLLTALMAVAFAIGAVLAGWGLQSLAQIRGYASAAATVTAAGGDTAQVVYTVGGQEYTAALGGLSPAPAVGDAITVCYSPADPSQPVQPDRRAPAVRAGVGAVLLVLSGGLWVALHPRKKDDDDD